MHIKKHLVFFFTILSLHTVRCQESLDYFEQAVQLFNKNIDSTIILLEKGIPYFEQNQNWEKYVNCFNGLSSCYHIKGNFQKSFFYAQEAMERAQLHLPNSTIAYSAALNNLANYAQEKGDFEMALDLYKQSLKIKVRDNHVESIISNLNNLGSCYFETGDYDQSKRYYKQSIEIASENTTINIVNRLRAVNELANIYELEEKLDTALSLYTVSLERINSIPNLSPAIQNNSLNEIYSKLAQIHLRKNSENKFWSIVSKIQFNAKKMTSIESRNGFLLAGKWHLKNSNHDKGLIELRNALRIAKLESKPLNRWTILGEIYHNISLCLSNQLKYKEAISMCDSALYHYNIQLKIDKNKYTNIKKNPTLDDNTIDILLTKAKLHLKQFETNQDPDAIKKSLYTYNYATELINKIRQSYLQEGSKEIFVAKAKSLFEEALNTWDIYQKNFPIDNQYTQIFQILENSKSMLLLQSLEAEKALGAAGIPDSLISKENELAQEISFYKIKLTEQANGNAEKIAAIESDLYQVEATYQVLIEQFEKDYPKYYNLKFNQKLTSLSEAKNQLPNNTTGLLNYFVGDKYLFTFFTSKTKTIFEKIEKPINFDTAILNLRKLVENPPIQSSAQKDFENFSSLSFELFNTLMNPIKGESNIEHLIIIPDGILNYLPFEILLSAQSKNDVVNYQSSKLPYLLNKFNISYRYSASLHKVLDKSTAKTKSDFIGFAPSFSANTLASQNARSCELESLGQLTCNKDEVIKIADLLQGTTFLDKNASKENFGNEIQNYRIAHFATHACLDDVDPMLNRIFMADSSVSNYELYNLKLPLELAVLSACNTGSGELKKGEGVISLSRGFFHAGCPSLLMSLWSVEDCTTSEIMTNYYGYLQNGNSKDVAVRKAKLDYLAQANKLGSHPFYWAPFIQLGSIEPITFGSGSKIYFFLLIPLLAFSIGFYLYKRTQNP